ncbi:MAG TPA: phosphoglycerate mutase, partial [Rhodanobacteraceae bacterium]|nr:phosphoglycerate mutase [Rhodanobacteraceae bacterium]
ADAEKLAHALRPLFGDAGAPLAVDTPSAWCAHLPGGEPPTAFTPPARALGIDLLDCLPTGEAGRSWRRLFNEAQVILHAHPVNAERVAAGRVPVNALWFWGAGALPAPIDTELKFIASTDAVMRGLARSVGMACADPAGVAEQGMDACSKDGDALLDFGAGEHGGFDEAWLPMFKAWLRKRLFDAIELTFADGERRRVRHIHRLRFWRHA